MYMYDLNYCLIKKALTITKYVILLSNILVLLFNFDFDKEIYYLDYEPF